MNIPNSFQTPNEYVDRYMGRLTCPEFMVLVYACRRTFGFERYSDRIAVSQFVDGIVRRDGTRLDCGTGLSESSVKRALKSLERYGLMVRMDDALNRNGTLWAPQLDFDRVDDAAIDAAYEQRKKSAAPAVAKGVTENPQNGQNQPQRGSHRTPQHNSNKSKRNNTAYYSAPATPDAAGKRDRLKRLEAAFSSATGLPRPSPATPKQRRAAAVRWWQPLQRIINATVAAGFPADKTFDLLVEAVEHMQSARLTISAPQSVEQVYLSKLGETVVGNRSNATAALFADAQGVRL